MNVHSSRAFLIVEKCCRLEFKYMKLMQSGPSKDCEEELPAAESCAIEEDEEEHFDSVAFSDTKKKGILGKLRTIRVGNNKVGHLNRLLLVFCTVCPPQEELPQRSRFVVVAMVTRFVHFNEGKSVLMCMLWVILHVLGLDIYSIRLIYR